MFEIERELRSTKAEELLSQIEDLFSEFRLEYLEMSRLVDNAEERIEELEADKVYLEEMLEEQGGRYWDFSITRSCFPGIPAYSRWTGTGFR